MLYLEEIMNHIKWQSFDSFNQPLWIQSKYLFQLWHMFVLYKNSSVMHCYSWRKKFAVQMKQKFWLWDWDLLHIYSCWMHSSYELQLSLFIHRTPNFNHFYVQSQCLSTWNFITIGKFLLGAIFLIKCTMIFFCISDI